MYSIEVSHRGISNKYLHLMFLLRTDINILKLSQIWADFLTEFLLKCFCLGLLTHLDSIRECLYWTDFLTEFLLKCFCSRP